MSVSIKVDTLTVSTYVDIMGNQVLLASGLTAGPLFSATYVLAGAMRVDYNPRRHPVSSLTLGPSGWVQTVNFLLVAVLSLLFAVGLWRVGPSAGGALLVGAWAVGLLGAGIFPTDPVRGYPPGTPDQAQRHTVAGALHDLCSFGGFLSLTAACFVFAPAGSLEWTACSIAGGVLFAASMVLSSAAFGPNQRLADLGGLIQRVSLTIGWTWLSLLALRTLYA